MGRKSKRNLDDTSMKPSTSVDVFPTAIYARLSIENSGKDDCGASIENQIDVCKEYIKEMPDLQLLRVYQDNGWTGTVMHRPAFDELLEDVRAGLIKAVVVRDLSRFARNYIETGTYLESIFPEMDVRFISVKERYDSLKADGTNESLMIPLQSLINDLYSKDISKKVETALHAQMEEGTLKWRMLPYGYKMNQEHTGIVPDEARARFVQNIFQWYSEGLSYVKIAKKLDVLDAPKHWRTEEMNDRPWNPASIYSILRNPIYTGKRVMGRYHTAIYKGIKFEKVPASDWYVTENSHEPLVADELFVAVNRKLDKNAEKRREDMAKSQKERAKLINIYKGKVFCADCGYGLFFHRHPEYGETKKWRADYYCSSWQTRKWIGCSYHYISMRSLNEKVLDALKIQINLALDFEDMIKKLKNTRTEQLVRNRLNDIIKSLSIKIGSLQKRKTQLYEDYTEGIVDEEEYLYIKTSYEREYDQLNRQLEACIQKRTDYIEAFSSENKWIKMIKSIRGTKKLTKDVVDAFIEKVTIYEGGRIEITMKYQDVFDLTKNYIAEIREQEE